MDPHRMGRTLTLNHHPRAAATHRGQTHISAANPTWLVARHGKGPPAFGETAAPRGAGSGNSSPRWRRGRHETPAGSPPSGARASVRGLVRGGTRRLLLSGSDPSAGRRRPTPLHAAMTRLTLPLRGRESSRAQESALSPGAPRSDRAEGAPCLPGHPGRRNSRVDRGDVGDGGGDERETTCGFKNGDEAQEQAACNHVAEPDGREALPSQKERGAEAVNCLRSPKRLSRRRDSLRQENRPGCRGSRRSGEWSPRLMELFRRGLESRPRSPE